MSNDGKSTFEVVVEAHDAVEVEPDRHLLIQMDTSLDEAIKAVQATGKKATVTLNIQVTKDGEGRVTFSPGVKATIPRPPMSSTTLWVKNGKLSTVNPHQKTLELTTPRAIRNPTEN